MSKTILITGASTGFGRGAAETLAKAGHRVFAGMRDIAGRNQTHAEALKAKGIHVVEIDVSDDASVEGGVKSVLEQARHLDVLVNNAGIGAAGISEAFTTDQLRSIFDVNVFGVHRTLRAALPAFRRQGDGLVINVGSYLGRLTIPFFGLYGASKFALEAITDSYRYELSQFGVDVVLLQPGSYPTNIFATALRPADSERFQSYGDVAGIFSQTVETFLGAMQGENAPDPHEVAGAIAHIVEQPKGSRRARVVVGNSHGAGAVNDQTAPIQKQLVQEFGLGMLDQ